MEYTLLELCSFFFIYSFIGWCGEVCTAALKRQKFVNRGLVNGFFCPIYGIVAVVESIFLTELREHILILFLAGVIISSVIEYITGKLMVRFFHKKLWDYSKERFHLEGFICLKYSLLWGILTVVVMLFVNPLICNILQWLPHWLCVGVCLGLGILAVLDIFTTCIAMRGIQLKAMYLAKVPRRLKYTSRWMENALTRWIQRRMEKSFPEINTNTLIEEWKEHWEKLQREEGHFAQGCGFYKLVSLFFIGAVLGDFVETIFCLITTGELMSRSSVVYGPFSIVWGLGCALLSALLYRYKDKSDGYIFLAGTLLGGAYEYICSVFTELVFGTVFWDYSGFTFNLGGRINLLYCFFWGIAAVVWVKWVYPFLSRMLERLPKKPAEIFCNILIVFMVVNTLISALALERYTERNTPETVEETMGREEQDGAVRKWLNKMLDEHFPDQRMERIYPNAKIVSEVENSFPGENFVIT